jgi:hypothetical protein
LVTIPFSSLQLNPSLVEFLRLTPTQVRSIRRLMDQERPTTELLVHELQIISPELNDATQEGTAKMKNLPKDSQLGKHGYSSS